MMENPMRRILPTATIQGRKLALLRRKIGAVEGLQAAPIARLPNGRPMRLSFAQERLWFLDRLGQVGPAYNISLAIRLRGPLDSGILSAALTEIVRRHAAVRTRFATREGVGIQIVDAPWIIELAPEPLDLARARSRAREIMEEPFDLVADRLLRCGLLRLGPDDHVLVLAIHHIVSDGWSVGVLFRELAALYGALSAGRTPVVPDLPIQYADYAAWHRSWLSDSVVQPQLAYWTSRLAQAPTGVEMPTDRPRPAAQSFRGAAHSFAIPSELRAALLGVAREQGATLFMVLLAAFKILLKRWSGQDDLVVGTPIAGRTRAETEHLIGFFVNLLALRTDLSGDPSFQTVVRRVKDTALGAYTHQDLPFEKLVDALQPERDLSRQPIFQVAFALQDVSLDQVGLPGLAVERFAEDSASARFDLELSMTDSGGTLVGSLSYATDLFDAATTERLTGQFVRLLHGVAANPQERISRLPLLWDGERGQILVDWNVTADAVPADGCLHTLFARQAARTPRDPAVVHRDQQLSYEELDANANQLAYYLRTLGVGADAVVGLCVERSFALLTGVLGILKAAVAFLPLDPSYPADRLAYMLADSGTRVVLTQASLVDQLPANDALIVRLDADWPEIARHPRHAPHDTIDPENLAYVIYTSGSTGRPKGVMIPHRGAANLAEAQVTPLAIAPGSRVLQFASFSFYAAVWELLMSWRSGAALVLADRHELLPGDPLCHLLERQRIGTVLLPPSALAALPDAPLQNLKTLIVGGEACSGEIVASWLGARTVLNAYGPTEASVCTTVFQCGTEGRTPIGRPPANTPH